VISVIAHAYCTRTSRPSVASDWCRVWCDRPVGRSAQVDVGDEAGARARCTALYRAGQTPARANACCTPAVLLLPTGTSVPLSVLERTRVELVQGPKHGVQLRDHAALKDDLHPPLGPPGGPQQLRQPGPLPLEVDHDDSRSPQASRASTRPSSPPSRTRTTTRSPLTRLAYSISNRVFPTPAGPRSTSTVAVSESGADHANSACNSCRRPRNDTTSLSGSNNQDGRGTAASRATGRTTARWSRCSSASTPARSAFRRSSDALTARPPSTPTTPAAEAPTTSPVVRPRSPSPMQHPRRPTPVPRPTEPSGERGTPPRLLPLHPGRTDASSPRRSAGHQAQSVTPMPPWNRGTSP